MKSSSLLLCVVVSITFIISCSCQRFTQGPFTFFGAGNNQYEFSHCLDASGSGNVFVVGSTDGINLGQNSVTGGSYDWFIAKYSKNNGFFTANANNPTYRFMLTPQEDQGTACDTDTSGAVYAAGVTRGSLGSTTRTGNDYDSVVVKYDVQMNKIWTNQFNAAGGSGNDWPRKIILSGNILYVFGGTNINGYKGYITALNPTTGAFVWSNPSIVSYGGSGDVYLGLMNAAVDPSSGSLVITGQYWNGGVPSGVNASGSIIPALPASGNYQAGYVASFTSTGGLQWQNAFSSIGYDNCYAVSIDLTGSVFVGGLVSGPVYGAPHVPNSVNSPLPYITKFDNRGGHQWTNILPRRDNLMIRHLAVDNIGGIYALEVNDDCWYVTSYSSPQSFGSIYSCAQGAQGINLIKADTNGAIQSIDAISRGLPFSFTLDNTGLLTIAGSFNGQNVATLHGASPTNNNVYNGFIDQQLLAFNCSCGNLASLVQQMSSLLNIVPN